MRLFPFLAIAMTASATTAVAHEAGHTHNHIVDGYSLIAAAGIALATAVVVAAFRRSNR